MSEQIKLISKIKTNTLTNFIQEIRYPFYKKLQPNSVVKFDSPFTALVGPNGSGKSSVLTSLYGAVRGNSLGKFWFSTKLDPIISDDAGGPPRIIYKYIPDGMTKQVEVIKLRVRSARTGKREDPDYWETAKPRKTDGMKDLSKVIEPDEAEHRSQFRWKAVDKKVIFVDFRKELSAFDISFYFSDIKSNPHYHTVQDFLRDRSKSLSRKLENPKSLPTSWHSQMIDKLNLLSDVELKWCNKILGKSYISAKRVKHSLFGNVGYSIIFEDQGHKYSEAVAGSGEVAVVNTVCSILSAPMNALILLDEPEVSLHPGAQNELRNLLFEIILEKQAQVVISTHSEHFLKGLPASSIKMFNQNPSNGLFQISNQITPDQAFSRLGGRNDTESTIYVEDDLAQAVITEAIRDIDPTVLNNYRIRPYPGGADTIKKHLPVQFAITDDISKDIVILDGDKRVSVHKKYKNRFKSKLDSGELVEKLFSSDVSITESRCLNGILSQQTGINGSTYLIPVDGGDAPKELKEKQKLESKLRILDKYHEKFHFMNTDTPEELVWLVAKGKLPEIYQELLLTGDYKTRFENSCIEMYGKSETNAVTILNMQKAFLKARDREHPLWVELLADVRQFLDLQ
ncbi:AAA family ATPase [Vibrio alginolyticus]|uniref:ATP-binding protein n=1 Tax=Vibrio alginolyticus TaxID=663 RepID=UPI001A8CAED7|nr:ATP-binding protein [Vibrio alginolyticus]MBO0161560.1 AAA family ATPase [Vibrio alginolyticus]